MSLTAIGDAEGLRAALAGGQNYDARDSSERSPLMLAAYISAVDCIAVLVEAAERAGGDDAVQAYLDAKDERTDMTALHRAVVYGSEATIRVGCAATGATAPHGRSEAHVDAAAPKQRPGVHSGLSLLRIVPFAALPRIQNKKYIPDAGAPQGWGLPHRRQ